MRSLPLTLFLLSTLTPACKQVSHQEKRHKPSELSPAAETSKDGDEVIILDASYENAPVDFLVLVDDGSQSGNFNDRMVYAADSLAARLAFLPSSFNFSMADLAESDGGAKFTARADLGVLTNDSKDLATTLKAQLGRDAGGQVSSANDPYGPAAAYVEVGVNGLRPGAFLAILLVTDRGAEVSPSALQALAGLQAKLDRQLGAGKWSLSTLTVDPSVAGLSDDEKNGCGTALNVDFAKTLGAVVDASKGLRGSLCSPSFASFFSDFPLDGGHQRSFDVAFRAGLDAGQLTIDVEGGLMTGWSYDAATGALRLPRSIARGAKIEVHVKPVGSVPVAARPKTPGAPTGGAAPTSTPSFFTTDIDPILRGNCNGGGCHGAGTKMPQFVGNEAVFTQRKADVLDRIQRPAGDPKRMPSGGLSPADLTKLVTYLNGL